MKTWEKLFAAALTLILAFAAVPSTPVHAGGPITVTVDGYKINFEDQQPVIVDDRVLVPVREVFEQMGFDVDWDPVERVATLTNAYFAVVIPAGESTFTVNGATFTPEVPQRMINNRFMLPLGAIAEAVDGIANWDSENRVAEIILTVITVPPMPTPAPEASPMPEVTPTPPPADSSEDVLAGNFVLDDFEYFFLTFADDGFTMTIPHSAMFGFYHHLAIPGDFIIYGTFSIDHEAQIISLYFDEASLYRAISNMVDIWTDVFEDIPYDLLWFIGDIFDVPYDELVVELLADLLDEITGWRLAFHDDFDRLYDVDYGDIFVRR